MEKLGKEVLFIKTDSGNPRNGEGAFIRLKNGSIMYAYTEYTGDSWLDHATARISAYFSEDEGESWKNKRILFEKGENDENIMSVSLMRMENDDIGIFYLTKTCINGTLCCNPTFRRSADEGKTWSDALKCIEENNYFVVNNDRIIRLKNGRILVPAALHDVSGCNYDPNKNTPFPAGKICFIASDDDGYSWKLLNEFLLPPFKDDRGLQEPGVYEHNDGTIWLWIRTKYGFQMQSTSQDSAESWKDIEPDFFFSSPESPMQIKKSGKYTLAVFNPIPRYTTRDDGVNNWGRSPLVCAVSTTDGKGTREKSFDKIFYVEDDRKNGYCYPAIFEGKDYFLTAYYHSEGTDVCLKSTKITKVTYKEIESI